jgi:type I restriction enzyme S subunit
MTEKKDWAWGELKDIATISSGNTPKGINNLKPSSDYHIPFYKISDMNTKGNENYMYSSHIAVSNSLVTKLKLRLEPKGTIIFPKRGGAILTNKKRRLSMESAYDLNIMGIKEKNETIFNEYLWYWFVKLDLGKLYDGSNVPQINNKDIEPLHFPIAPLPEQRAIVAKIEQLFSELDNGIANLKKAQEQLKVYRQAVLKKAFEGEFTKAWRAKQSRLPTAEELLEQIKRARETFYQQRVEGWALEVDIWEANNKEDKKPAKPKIPKELPPLTKEELEKLAELPENWQFTRLGELAELVGGVTKGRKLEGKELVSLPYLRVANVQDGYLDLSEIKYIDVLPEDLKKYRLEYGDILYTEGGDKDKLGRGTIWKDEIEECIHQNHVFRARLYSIISSPRFVAYYSQTKAAKNYFYSNAKQTTNLASINMTVLSNLPIPVISSAEQHQIVQEIESRLSVCDKVEETIKESLVKAEALRQSILKKAFEGELLTEQELETCRQAPDWEPAEQLLERIKAEKVGSGKNKTKEAFV